MEKNPKVIDILNTSEIKKIVTEIYLIEKERLKKEFQIIDDKTMIAYLRAFITNKYQELSNDSEKKYFIEALRSKFIIVDLMDEFIESINATKARAGELIDEDVREELEELAEYKDTKIYKELSKSDKEIAKIINEYHGYISLNQLKKGAQEEGPYFGYKISQEEIEIIELTKKYYIPNQLAHMLYDEKREDGLFCDHEIHNDNEVLKELLVSTNKNNPSYEIIFPDGKIVEYFKGDIRVKPYTYKQVLEYTKLYYVQNYKEMKECYSTEEDIPSYEVGRRMILNSFINVRAMLYKYEDIYTQKMIDDSKKTLVRMKETSKKYDL